MNTFDALKSHGLNVSEEQMDVLVSSGAIKINDVLVKETEKCWTPLMTGTTIYFGFTNPIILFIGGFVNKVGTKCEILQGSMRMKTLIDTWKYFSPEKFTRKN